MVSELQDFYFAVGSFELQFRALPFGNVLDADRALRENVPGSVDGSGVRLVDDVRLFLSAEDPEKLLHEVIEALPGIYIFLVPAQNFVEVVEVGLHVIKYRNFNDMPE